jgi:hypothetical protein
MYPDLAHEAQPLTGATRHVVRGGRGGGGGSSNTTRKYESAPEWNSSRSAPLSSAAPSVSSRSTEQQYGAAVHLLHTHRPPDSLQARLDAFFSIAKRGSSVRTEIHAGLVTCESNTKRRRTQNTLLCCSCILHRTRISLHT